MSVYRRIRTGKRGKVCLVGFVDRVINDAANVEEIGDDLFDLVDRDGEMNILLSFEGVQCFSSAGLNKLIVFQEKRPEVRLILCRIDDDELVRTFETTGLIDGTFEYIRDEKEAIAAF